MKLELKQKQLRPGSTLAEVISTLLYSAEQEDIDYGLQKLMPIIEEAGGKLLVAAEQSRISHRTLCRWQAELPEVAELIAVIRKANGKPETSRLEQSPQLPEGPISETEQQPTKGRRSALPAVKMRTATANYVDTPGNEGVRLGSMGAPKLSEDANDRIRQAMRNLLDTRYEGNRSKLAEALGRSQPSISDFLNGKAGASFETVERLAELLEIPVWELLGEASPQDTTRAAPHPAKSYSVAANSEAAREQVVEALPEGTPLTIGLSLEDRELLDRLVQRRAAELEDEGLSVTASSVLRALIRREARAVGLLPPASGEAKSGRR